MGEPSTQQVQMGRQAGLGPRRDSGQTAPCDQGCNTPCRVQSGPWGAPQAQSQPDLETPPAPPPTPQPLEPPTHPYLCTKPSVTQVVPRLLCDV